MQSCDVYRAMEVILHTLRRLSVNLLPSSIPTINDQLFLLAIAVVLRMEVLPVTQS